MNINLKPLEILKINGDDFVVQPDPDPSMVNRPYIELGGSGLVVRLLKEKTQRYYALKIFNNPEEESLFSFDAIKKYKISSLPGLSTAERLVLNPKDNKFQGILNKNPNLKYSVLMPWIGGYTWFEILGDNKGAKKIPAFSKNSCIYYAELLSLILASLEAKGYAHCDLCSNNIIIDMQNKDIQLIDIEDMYLPEARKTKDFIGGQDGYAHPIARNVIGHQWVKESDRYGGGLLISEIFTWHDEDIRNASGSDSYASPDELGKNLKKYKTMKKVINVQGGKELEGLFEEMWESDSLENCPPLSSWHAKLKELVEEKEISKDSLASISQLGNDGKIRIGRTRINISGQTPQNSNTEVFGKRPIDMNPVSTMPKPGAQLQGFRPTTDWGKVMRLLFFTGLLIGACILASSLITTGYAIINAQPTSTSTSIYNSPTPKRLFTPTPRPTATPRLISTSTPRLISTSTLPPPFLSDCLTIKNAESSSTSSGNVIKIFCNNRYTYDMAPMSNGVYQLGPDKKFIVYAGVDGFLYIAKVGSNTWTVLENLKRSGEFGVFGMNETPRFGFNFTGNGNSDSPFWLTVKESTFSGQITIQIPLKYSK